MTVRRVVTGHDRDGHGRVVDDRTVEPITSELLPGFAAYGLWGHDQRPTFPDDGAPDGASAWFPPPDGSRLMINHIPPGNPAPDPGVDTDAALAHLDRQMPGAMALMDPGEPGMHTTDSLDYVLVVSGEVTLDLGDGEGTLLHAGDVVVQNGTRHAWRNHGSEACVILGVAVGARRTRAEASNLRR